MRYKRTNGGSTQQKSGVSHTDFLSWLSLNVFTPLASLIFLAFWRLRQSWNLLLLVGIGMIVSVTLVCTIPLYTFVATSAGVRGAFASNLQQQYITINGFGKPGFSLSNSQQFKGKLDQLFQQYLGSNVNDAPQFVAQTAFSPLANPHLLDTTHINYAVGLNSYDMQAVQQVAIQAIDTNTFAQTVTWTGQDSKQSLSTLMNQLTAARNNIGFSNTIPAIVDAAMWNALNLSQGETFSLSDPQTALNFVAIGEVQHIPTIVDGNASGNSGGNDGESIEGDIIVDYQNYITSYMTASAISDISKLPVHINYMWLKTTTDSTVLAHIRSTLTTSSLQLNPLNDNAALLAQLQQSTTQHNLISMISFVAVAPLLLALVGSLLASWMSVRSRLTSFAVLRALGCTPRQVASTLSIELIFVYVSAIILGCVLGLIFAFQTVPHLVFTNASSSANSGQVFLAQSVPAVRAVIPNTLVLLLGLFIFLCFGTLAFMVYTVSRPATGQTLRVNED